MTDDTGQKPEIRAAVLVIGNEILNGRTQDSNIHYIARQLESVGIRLAEARVIADQQAVIIAALNALRAQYDYVFTTGGIGPTHDDITAESVAAAFNVVLEQNPEAMRRLEQHYAEGDFTPARQRMARIPAGARLIDNPVSVAPGFIIDNVHVLPGVPKIMQPMLAGILPGLRGGPKMHSATVSCLVPESMLADGLAAIQAEYPSVDIGSYPYMRPGQTGVSIVVRSIASEQIDKILPVLTRLIESNGAEFSVFRG